MENFLRVAMPAFFALFFGLTLVLPANANANWSLGDADRRAFLEYYAPIIFKRANGNDGEIGRDWISNYDFDQDFRFNDNKREWRDIGALVSASAAARSNARFESWRLTPTLYTSILEYMDGGRKNLVLIYQVYYPFQENAAKKRDIHDFERIEIHIKNVSTTRRPNSGEVAEFAVVTQHKRSVKRGRGSPDYNFFKTSTGNHLLLWQAEHTGKLTGPHGNEIRFVEDSAARIFYEMGRNIDAEVEIIGTSNDKNVHLIFVPAFSSDAVAQFRARPLNYQTAASLASPYDNGKDIRWSNVKRIQYNLQDLADINSTKWSRGPFYRHWRTGESEQVFVETPFKDPENRLIPYGQQLFYTEKADIENGPTEPGILGKGWFWGVYEIRDVCDVNITSLCLSSAREFRRNSFAGTHRDIKGRTRIQANGGLGRANFSWYQHDYFVHSGIADGRSGTEIGFWLPRGWNTPAQGGFDGRWANLFPDDEDVVSTLPLVARVAVPSNTCVVEAPVTASATGGKQPYTFTWKFNGSTFAQQTGVTRSTQMLFANQPFTVDVRDANGTLKTLSAYFRTSCQGGFPDLR